MEVYYYYYCGFSAINAHLAPRRLIYSGCSVFRDPPQSAEPRYYANKEFPGVHIRARRAEIAVTHF